MLRSGGGGRCLGKQRAREALCSWWLVRLEATFTSGTRVASKAYKRRQDNQGPGDVRINQKARFIDENRNTLEVVARHWIKHQSIRWMLVTVSAYGASICLARWRVA